MSSLERREVTTTRVVRTLSPQKASSSQNLSEFDNNLDHLLEDLQSSVSRPGSSLGNAYHETRTTTYTSGTGHGAHAKGDSLGRVQYLQPANPTTIINDDYNYKPADSSKLIKTYKTENYSTQSYNSGIDVPDNVRMQNNINKLDTLLDDLQQVRQGTLDSKDRGREVKKTVTRELVYEDDKIISDRENRREGSVTRDIEFINDGTYGDLRPIRHSSPSRTLKSSKVEEYKYSSDTHGAHEPNQLVKVDSSINPDILSQLDPNLLPAPNTKVTTTIKTYTYEIPGYPPGVSPKLAETIYSSNQSTPSKSFQYNKVENTSSSQNVLTPYPGDYVRPVSPNPVGFKNKYLETTTTTTRTDGGYGRPSPTPNRIGKESYVYNETKNINEYPPSPPTKHVYKETTTTRNVNNGYPNNNYPPGPGNKTYIINETHTTRNVNHPNGYPNDPPPTVIYKHDTHTINNNYPPPKHMTETFNPKSGPGPQDMNITYKYTTHSTTTNNYKGYPNETEPLIHTPPFPTDGGDVDGKGPPKHLDELMAEFGNEVITPPAGPYNAGYLARQAELETQRKEARKEATESSQKKDMKDLPKTKNIAGPPVYYPPNHEMFAHKEESGGYRAEGGMMKESGKYKYEAKSSSKSKSSSGMAVVPVCLPLCCGLPCAIL